MNMKHLFVSAVVLIAAMCCAGSARAQEHPRFWAEVQHFKALDSAQPPAQNAILFIGSSSIALWTDIQSYFPGYTIISRGLGGATIPDLTRYVGDIVVPYHPKEIFIYCGENDVAQDSVDSKIVADRFKDLFATIRQYLPGVPIAYIGMKPSPSRAYFFHLMKQGNQIIKNFLWTQQNVMYVNVWDLMVDPNGNPRPELFLGDSLHMKPEGYAIWKNAIQPYLLK